MGRPWGLCTQLPPSFPRYVVHRKIAMERFDSLVTQALVMRRNLWAQFKDEADATSINHQHVVSLDPGFTLVLF